MPEISCAVFEKYHITNCRALKNYQVQLFFADGASGVVDLKYLAGKGVFEIWNDYEKFKEVYVDQESKTICWNKDIDLDPINLRENLRT